MRTMLRIWGTGMLALTIAACGQEGDEPFDPGDIDPALASEVEASLSAFEKDPNTFLNTRPAKLIPSTDQPLTAGVDALAAKDNENFGPRGSVDPKADAPGINDQARNLVDSLTLTKLADMESLKSATLAESPWSDDYWGLYAGSIGKRYSDSNYRPTDNWTKNVAALKASTPANKDDLSPAEKYDLLVGDAAKTMTTYNWNTGMPYATAAGTVETWMGICHGWAPAAYMVPRPQKAVEVTAADGVTKIKFYPSDMKALASSLWATNRFSTKFIGGRCNVKDPAKDSIGRIKDTACRDTNAATWHLAIVNQIGKNRRSMVLDATFDYEVWNQPVYSYRYSYFNPKTNRSTSYLSSARVAVTDTAFTDKFKAYRAPGTTHIVGIAMDVKWTVETQPNHNTPDSPSKDAISGARYMYTLELDKDGNIIGGEWMQNAHPDFLWTPTKDAVAKPFGEPSAALTWDGTKALDAAWRTAAPSASRVGSPLAGIVGALVGLSRK